MTQFNRGAQHVVQRKEDRHLNNQREAAAQRVHFLRFIQRHHLLALTLFIVAQTLAHGLNLRLQHTHLRHGGVLRFGQRVHDATNDKGDDDDREAPVAEEAVDELQQLEQRLGDEPQPAVVDGQIQVRRDGSHFVLNRRADPQRALQFVGLTRLYQYRLRFIADSNNAVAEVGGIEVIRPVILRHPRSGEVLLQHGNPTVFGANVQVFVIQNGIEFVFFVFRIRGGERCATESMHRGQAAGLRIATGRQRSGLLQLTEGRDFQRFLAGILHAITDVHRIATAFQGEGFGEDVAGFVGVGQRDDELILAIGQHKRLFIDAVQRTRAVCRVIRTVTAG